MSNEWIEKPYAYCCNGDPKYCDCIKPNHGTALFLPIIPGNRAALPPPPAPSPDRLVVAVTEFLAAEDAVEVEAQLVSRPGVPIWFSAPSARRAHALSNLRAILATSTAGGKA